MLVNEVKIENIKGFGAGVEGVSLNFERADGSVPRWIVVAGRNGAGKSTFLQSLALAISGQYAARALRRSYASWLREGADAGQCVARLTYSDADSMSAAQRSGNLLWVGLSWERSDGPEPAILPTKGSPFPGLDPAHGPWANNPKGWFLAGYGPFRRITSAPTDAQNLMVFPGRPGSLASLFHEEASLSEALTWLQRIYLRRLENEPHAAETEETVLRVLNDGLLPEGMRVLRVTSDGLWVETPTGAELPLGMLSDGYRAAAALVLDLLRQLANTFGGLQVLPGNPRTAFAHEGVVLIDEIDVHMHVSWQQRIGFWLKEHFPNVQFIVTTHSPFICQAADERGLVRLPAPGERDGARIIEGELFNRVVNGTVDNAVLTDLFGLDTAYSARATALRNEVASLETRAARDTISPTDLQRLEDLRGRLPRTPSSDVADALRQLTARLDDAED